MASSGREEGENKGWGGCAGGSLYDSGYQLLIKPCFAYQVSITYQTMFSACLIFSQHSPRLLQISIRRRSAEVVSDRASQTGHFIYINTRDSSRWSFKEKYEK
jgi:hypothetical protein